MHWARQEGGSDPVGPFPEAQIDAGRLDLIFVKRAGKADKPRFTSPRYGMGGEDSLAAGLAFGVGNRLVHGSIGRIWRIDASEIGEQWKTRSIAVD